MPANFLHPWISHIRHGHWLRWWLAALVCAGQCGCVQRRFTVRSNPPGAVVYVDDYEIGTTPVSHDFVYYGTRKIRLVKDGYETLTVMQKFPTPWYQIIGIDFIAENLVPGEIRDERVVDYQLQPQIIVPTEQLLGRAENLRRGSQPPTTVVPAGAITPAVAPVASPTGVLPPPPTNTQPPANSVPPQGFLPPPAGPPAGTAISPYTGQPSYGPQTFGPPATAAQPGTFAAPPGMQPPAGQPPVNPAAPPGVYNPPGYNQPPQNNPPLYPPPNY
jgi:hypothetical protein